MVSRLQCSPVAQLVEQVTVNHWVGGSSPSRGAIFLASELKVFSLYSDRICIYSAALYYFFHHRLCIVQSNPIGKKKYHRYKHYFEQRDDPKYIKKISNQSGQPKMGTMTTSDAIKLPDNFYGVHHDHQ